MSFLGKCRFNNNTLRKNYLLLKIYIFFLII